MRTIGVVTLVVVAFTCVLSTVCASATHSHVTHPPSGGQTQGILGALGEKAQGAMALIGQELGGELLDGAKQLIGTLTNYINDNLLGNHPFQVILGRGVRISASATSVSIQDVSSGLAAVGHGATQQDALADATTQFVALLLQVGIISKDDLHLAPAPRTTAATPCGDNFPQHYCSNYARMCSNSAISSFLKKNCFKTCSGC